MSDLSVTGHNLASLFAGQITFSQFRDGEVALIRRNIADLPPAIQPATELMVASLEAGASVLVGAGQTALGKLLNDTSDHQATMVLNLLTLAGVPTAGPLSIAEHAAAVTIINGLKAGLDHVGLQITSGGVVEKPASQS